MITDLRNFFEKNFDERVRLPKLRGQLVRLDVADPDVADHHRSWGQVAAAAEEEDQAAADLLEAVIRETRARYWKGWLVRAPLAGRQTLDEAEH